jgi:hypothetical protein
MKVHTSKDWLSQPPLRVLNGFVLMRVVEDYIAIKREYIKERELLNLVALLPMLLLELLT